MILDLVTGFQGAPHVQLVSAAEGNSVASIFKKISAPGLETLGWRCC